MWQGSLKKLGAYIYRLPYARLLITYLSADSLYRKHKIKATEQLSVGSFLRFFWKPNMEEELVSEIRNE